MITVDILQGGVNNHGVTVDDFNAIQTDFLTDGVVGSFGNTGSVAPMTGAFGLNAQDTPDMTIKCLAGVAYVTGTPTSGVSQRLRVKMTTDQNITIPSNSTGGTRYDWIYIKLDADKMKDPAVDASDVATLVTSRSTSAVVDNGSAPTYGLCLGIVTVANGISAISNISIYDKRTSSSLAATAQSGSGWVLAPALTFGAADGPSFTATATGDVTNLLYPGVRVKGQQVQALSNYWTFDTNNADSKGSAVMADIGTPTYTAGKFGNALTLNGTNQALSITDAAGYKPTGEFTLGCWFKTSNTGAYKNIFQSYSQNPNASGINLRVTDTNLLNFTSGPNVSGSVYSLSGTTTVTDGNFHYAVVSYRNNFVQVYLDGKLEMSGYIATPAYAATNYVRIGCGSYAGVNQHWFNGQIDDLFLINGYALDEQTIKAKYDAATAQGTSDLTLTKYFLCTKSSYSAPNTTVTLYGGTDHTLTNATISNAYYSSQKAPYGFPLNPAKWTVELQDTAERGQTSPTANTWYNMGSLQLSVPIGGWKLEYFTNFGGFKSGTGVDFFVSLSDLNNAVTDTTMSSWHQVEGASGTISSRLPHTRTKSILLDTKKTKYLIAKTATTGVNELVFHGGQTPTIIRATSTLL